MFDDVLPMDTTLEPPSGHCWMAIIETAAAAYQRANDPAHRRLLVRTKVAARRGRSARRACFAAVTRRERRGAAHTKRVIRCLQALGLLAPDDDIGRLFRPNDKGWRA